LVQTFVKKKKKKYLKETFVIEFFQAKFLFYKGMKLEQAGHLYEGNILLITGVYMVNMYFKVLF
jgi:hypothetical protein